MTGPSSSAVPVSAAARSGSAPSLGLPSTREHSGRRALKHERDAAVTDASPRPGGKAGDSHSIALSGAISREVGPNGDAGDNSWKPWRSTKEADSSSAALAVRTRGAESSKKTSSGRKDGQGRNRQVVSLLDKNRDLTGGKGEAFGVSGKKGSQSLMQRSDAQMASDLIKERQKSEAERGGLFQKGAIREHAPVGRRKFSFGLGCF